MNSIQLRLTARLVAGVIAVSILGSLAVYLVFRSSIVRQFDEGLAAEAHAIASLFRRDHDGGYEFLPPQQIEKMFHHGDHPDIYCIRRMDGRIVLKSSSLGKKDCPGLEHPTNYEGLHHVVLKGRHDHRRYLRGIFITFVPASETGVARERFQLVVAADREEVDHLLARLLQALGLVSIAAGLATFGLVAWTVRHDLKPLRALAQQAGRIGASDAEKRFAVDGVPPELEPIHRALNGLLQRMRDALQRERRFTADVAHELRTPVAELRSLCEVAAASDDPGVAAEALHDAREIGAQMENLINALLALRRSQEQTTPLQPVEIVSVVRESWQGVEAQAGERELSATFEMPETAEVLCDKTMLAAVLRNLFENAAGYTHKGGAVACTVSPAGICIRNRPHDLTEADIAHLTEPFWRKSASRTDGTHAGLGLALADAYCRAFGGELAIALGEDGWAAFEIRFAQREG